MDALRKAAEQALEALVDLQGRQFDEGDLYSLDEDIAVLRAALAQQGATVKEYLQVPQSIASAMTASDLAWLETRRLVRVWEELGQMRWAGADEGWDKAIEKVRNRLDKECQDVLAWKERVEASGETAVQLLQRMKHE